jgi:hypothetical protein
MKIVSLVQLDVAACSPNTTPAMEGRKQHPFKISAVVKGEKKIRGSERTVEETIVVEMNSEVQVSEGLCTAVIAHGRLENGKEWHRLVRVLPANMLISEVFSEKKENRGGAK